MCSGSCKVMQCAMQQFILRSLHVCSPCSCICAAIGLLCHVRFVPGHIPAGLTEARLLVNPLA